MTAETCDPVPTSTVARSYYSAYISSHWSKPMPLLWFYQCILPANSTTQADAWSTHGTLTEQHHFTTRVPPANTTFLWQPACTLMPAAPICTPTAATIAQQLHHPECHRLHSDYSLPPGTYFANRWQCGLLHLQSTPIIHATYMHSHHSHPDRADAGSDAHYNKTTHHMTRFVVRGTQGVRR